MNAKATSIVLCLLLLVSWAAVSKIGSVQVNAEAIENSWTAKAPVPVESAEYKSAAVNGKVYIIGSSNNYMYDPVTDTWTVKNPMITPRWGYGVAAFRNKIYVIGGSTLNSGEMTGINEVYDPAMNSWETRAMMPTPKRGIDANVVNGKIYIIGGGTNITEMYDPATDTWTAKALMPSSVSRYASAAVDNRIYIMGGMDETQSPITPTTRMDTNQVYDTSTDTWSLGAPLPIGVRYAAGGATAGLWAPKRIYVIGGVSDQDGINATQVYNPETDTWTAGAPMPTPRLAIALAVAKDKLYAMAGLTSSLGVYSKVNEEYTPFGYGTLTPETTPPAVSIDSPENKTYDSAEVSLAFTLSEPASWIGYSLDGEATVAIDGNTTLTGLLNGSHNLTVYAQDAAGNTGTSETTYFVIEAQQSQPQPSAPFPTMWFVVALAVIAACAVGITLAVTIRRRKKTNIT